MLQTPSAGGFNDGEDLLGIAVRDEFGQYAEPIARHEQALGRPAPAPIEPGRNGAPRLAPRFVEWMMMLPNGWVTGVPGLTRSQQLRMLGNGVVPAQAEAALAWLSRVAEVAA